MAVLILATVAPAIPIFQPYFVHGPLMREVSVPKLSTLAPIADRYTSPAGSYVVLQPIAIYLISGLYISTVLFFSLRLCWILRCTSKLVRNSEPAAIEPDHLAMWNRSKNTFLVRSAALLRSHDVPGPVTAGFWRPALLLPDTFIEEHSQTEFLAAIGHECAHIKRNDCLKNMLYELLGLLTAFHPVTWFIKSQIAQTREMVCDRMAAEGLLDSRSYGQSLLRLAAKMPSSGPSTVFHTVGMFDTNILERRIVTLIASMPRVSRLRYHVSSIASILLLSICAGVSGSFAQPVATQASKPSIRSDSGIKKQESGKDLSCTYYDKKTMPHPGTCGIDEQDEIKYRCYSNQDPAQSNPQLACESKVLRALKTKK
ncbi:MAG TPA: M56 family metallopeptidase [Bryobacteraceae bacterium]|nr:M56 family metallopeptidase [Bryobacteraceae bacterium]